jgi:hypothetical protein
VIQVLARLSRSVRCRAGRTVALIYLLCVLAPSFAFAFGAGGLSEHCLFDDGPVAALPYHLDVASSETRAHSFNHLHAHDHGGASHHHDASMHKADESSRAVPHSGHHAPIDLQCCGMLSIPAMPAAVTEVVTPSTPQAFLVPEAGRHLVENPPALLYRPPIS